MSRADDIRARADAEIAVAELEEQLLAAKETGDVPADLKHDLRAARQAFRQLREGDAVAAPETITATAEVQEG